MSADRRESVEKGVWPPFPQSLELANVRLVPNFILKLNEFTGLGPIRGAGITGSGELDHTPAPKKASVTYGSNETGEPSIRTLRHAHENGFLTEGFLRDD
ncbi:hypothetical protein RISK_004958 [Rhodopirellula islandica]|uniref:Uncharacterized protein n=1 Tax=Rhodopirellula islandica TaxID=595434 RepID=A0A0J1B8Y9_RHOIS|nr:hypothetical protein [Rhodopirellula islandica]KLU02988.1 hypothetical protein RISK_004958 [Rhodopirellula islandica]